MICPTLSIGETTMVTIQIITQGNGQIKSSGGDNELAVRSSITVPAEYDVYFEAVPAQGETFQKWVSADGIESTTNPITLTANEDGSITGVFSGASSSSSTTGLIIAAAAGIAALVLFSRKR